jgi:glycosyltransferase A (GT-A) superfamily protein (DUF2064 family)
MIGLRRPVAALFDKMIWSSPEVLAATLERAKGLGLKTSLAPQWYDVDTPSDLAELQAAAHRLDPAVAERTRRWLEKREGAVK